MGRRRVLAGVLHTRAEVREVMMEDDVSDDGSGPPDRADPGREEAAAQLRYASDVMEVVETYVCRPVFGFFMAIVAADKRLQSGRLDAYLAYMLIALVAIIAWSPPWPDPRRRGRSRDAPG
jgi:hydrogenase-4 component B